MTDHCDREAAHLAVLQHIADSGHTGETMVSGHFEVWRSAVDDRVSVRAHRLTITIGVCADGTYALPG